MDSKLKRASIYLMAVVLLLLVSFTVGFADAEYSYTSVKENSVSSVPDSVTVVSYSGLDSEAQETFREIIAGSATHPAKVDVPDGADYIQLDGRNYEVVEETEQNYLVLYNLFLSVMWVFSFIFVVAGVYNTALYFDLGKNVFFAGSVVILVLAGLVLYSLVLPAPYAFDSVSTIPVSAVAPSDTVSDASKYSDSEYSKLSKAFAKSNGGYVVVGDFISDDVDYVKSDGEYYGVRHQYGVSIQDKFKSAFMVFVYVLVGLGLAKSFYSEFGEMFSEVDSSGGTPA